MEQSSGYQPVACDFHDRLESFATLRRRVRLSLKEVPLAGGGSEGGLSAQGRIEDIFTRPDKQEFLRLDDGEEIRLDRIADVEPID
jgi:transcriptional antiterminator Rof (Rho-off)